MTACMQAAIDGAATELDAFYQERDPWSYETTEDDAVRKRRLLSLLPKRDYGRVLDIGCGNGFLTEDLPGSHVLGCDISENAVRWARERISSRADRDRFEFRRAGLFDLSSEQIGRFDLIVITGVLYPHYIGSSFSLVRLVIDDLLADGGVLVSCHIQEWYAHRFPYTLVDASFYPYRDFHHRLEVFVK